uniref:Family with sequence similarity 107 member A n=1 Tax=Latimeria chalumnae TaxID=7897 RepID=H3AUT6_LATCH
MDCEGNVAQKPVSPCKPSNPVRVSGTHRVLLQELVLTHKKGLGLHSRPELLRVLEKRRQEQEDWEEAAREQTPLAKELQKRQQRKEELQQEQKKEKEVKEKYEFLYVKENLRKTTQPNPPSNSS